MLPLTLTLAQVLLVWLEMGRQMYPPGIRRNAAYHVARYQEGGMPIDPIRPAPLTLAFKVAIVLNLPAVFAGALVAAALSLESDLSLLWASTLFVPLLWFGIGRWLDGVFGFRPRPARLPSPWRGFWVLLSVGFLLLAVSSIAHLDRNFTSDAIWITAALSFWSVLFLAMSGSGYVQRASNA